MDGRRSASADYNDLRGGKMSRSERRCIPGIAEQRSQAAGCNQIAGVEFRKQDLGRAFLSQNSRSRSRDCRAWCRSRAAAMQGAWFRRSRRREHSRDQQENDVPAHHEPRTMGGRQHS